MKIAFCISGRQGAEIELVMMLLQKRDHEITVFMDNDSPAYTDHVRDRFEVVLLEGLLFRNHELLIKLYAKLICFSCVLYDHYSVVRAFSDQLPRRMEFNVTPRFFPTSEYPNPTFNQLYIPPFNKLSYLLMAPATLVKRKELILFRKHLPPRCKSAAIPSLYGMSTTLLRKPIDYPMNSYFSGLWISKVRLPTDSGRLLEKLSKKKILILINGQTQSNARFLQLCGEICSSLNVQPIVINCSENADGYRYLIDNKMLFFSDSAEKLIPFVDAVIHAGYYQNSMQCLYYGKPALVYTTALVQNSDGRFWKDISYENNCSVKSISMDRVTRKELTCKMKLLLNEKQMNTRCSEISDQLKKEDGVKKAADLIELYFSSSFYLMPHSLVTDAAGSVL